MNVLVIGATGQTGRLVVDELIKRGHAVTAYARTPSKVDRHDGQVAVAEGDARDQAALQQAISGHDAVVAAFGPRSFKKDDLQTVFFQNLVNAMPAAGVNRLVALSAWGSGTSVGESPWFFRVLHKTMLRNVFVDKANGEQAILESNLNYTLVRPGVLGNGKAQGNIKASLKGEGLRPFINRADVANFMVDQITDSTWERQAPLIGY